VKLVWVNGCFDVLHRGHFEMLEYAKSLGNYLMVGIDSDQKVKKDKGDDRPFNNAEDRKFALESIRHVDKVLVFNSRAELEHLIKLLEPDYMVVGSDWKGKEVVGAQYCTELKFFDRIDRYSTTNILENNR
jgi:D-beta-D-heptose 7-phosphate kinase/D-beta-D-heptose 1-phosphate adenosyltransferase|tara:strand:+ start:239 stop:631 length:393 start_codon:yes stop_codon:yes gene_type:complete